MKLTREQVEIKPYAGNPDRVTVAIDGVHFWCPREFADLALTALSAEPVACIHPDTLAMLNDPVQGRDGGTCWRRSKLKFDQAYIPLYRAPPSLLAENKRLREALELAVPRRVENKVTVDAQGVLFGKNYWVSHETITGCVADLIPKYHPQYWEWVLCAALREPK